MIKVHIKDETSPLRAVVLGIATGMEDVYRLEDAHDPKSLQHIMAGTFPKKAALDAELSGFEKVLVKYGVEVYRPREIEHCNQVFARDIGFVIDDIFVEPRILESRSKEIGGIKHLIDQVPDDKKIKVPEDVRIEGGDVMLWKDKLFVGYSKQPDFDRYTVARTNEAGLQFLRSAFPFREVYGFELNKSDYDPFVNALHLDCLFQPVGDDKAIIHKDGFKNREDYEFLIDCFGTKNVFRIDSHEMYAMHSNIFSITPQVVVSEKSFAPLNNQLRDWGIIVEEVDFAEVAKMEGLLRCATLPLIRA